jgi:hypothetical protein
VGKEYGQQLAAGNQQLCHQIDIGGAQAGVNGAKAGVLDDVGKLPSVFGYQIKDISL